MAGITATPLPLSLWMFVLLMPPIAITGILTASQMACSVSKLISWASALLLVGNIAPTPK